MYRGNLVTWRGGFYIVANVGVRTLDLISATQSNCGAGPRLRHIGTEVVAVVTNPELEHDVDAMDEGELLRNFRVTVIARSLKEYITQRLLRPFDELR